MKPTRRSDRHENYLVTRKFPFSRHGLSPLVTFLVTRQIYTGSGRVGAAAPQEQWVQVGDTSAM